MQEEQQDSEDLLEDIEAEFIEKKAARYVRRVKHGRAAIFIIALLNSVTLARGIAAYEQIPERALTAGSITLFYAVLFVMSLRRSFIALAIGTVAYVLLGAYTFIDERYMLRFIFDSNVTGIQQAAYLSTIAVRLIILYFLVIATINASRFEALYPDNKE